MNVTADPNLWIMAILVFLLGLLIGVFLTAGGRRKWKTRYDSEVQRRRDLERTHEEREKHWVRQEKEWRERDSLRGAGAKGRRDTDADGVPDRSDDRPLDDRKA